MNIHTIAVQATKIVTNLSVGSVIATVVKKNIPKADGPLQELTNVVGTFIIIAVVTSVVTDKFVNDVWPNG